MDVGIEHPKQDSWDQLQLLENHSFRLSLSPQLQQGIMASSRYLESRKEMFSLKLK